MLKSVLVWEKPIKVLSKEEWAERSADGLPPGAYTSNMSEAADQMKWKARVVGKKTGFPQVEMRRNGMVVILSHKGFKYKHYDCRQTPENLKEGKKWDYDVDNVVHISSSGPQAFNLQEYEDFQMALKEGWHELEEVVAELGLEDE